MTCIIDSDNDVIYSICYDTTVIFVVKILCLLLDIFLDDRLHIPLLSRLERLDVG